MRARGRVLALARAGVQRDSEEPPQRGATEEPRPTRESAQEVQNGTRPIRGGRGGRIARALASIQLEQSQPQHVSEQNDSESGDSEQVRSRRASTGSRSSELSQHFASVENPLTSVLTVLPKEPSTMGEKVQLSINYMTFNTTSDTPIEQYHVEFKPDIESVRLRASLLRSEPARGVIGCVTNWTGTNLYLPHKLPQKVTLIDTTHPATGNSLQIRITYVKTPPTEELVQFYNSLMHKVMYRLKYMVFNRQHYSPMQRISIEEFKLEVWPGWITAVQKLDGGLKLNIDSSFKVVRLETVRDILRAIKERCRSSNIKEAFEAQLIGSIVMTKYNNKAYRIDGIDISKKPSDKFKIDRDGAQKEISYIDYMLEHWHIRVNDPNQPMIIHHPKPKRGMTAPETVYLIPELCVATGLTDEMRANFSLMKAVGDHTRLPPDIRETKLTEFLEQLATNDDAKTVLSEWNLSVRPQLDITIGRRLENDSVIFGDGRQAKVPDNVDWTRAATSGQVFKSVDIKKWVIMFTERDNPIAEDLMCHMKEVSRVLGIKFMEPRVIKLQNDSSTTYVNALRREVTQDDQMVVLLTPGKGQREDRYSACKRLLSCEKSVPCQFIRCGTISNPRRVRSICQKIVIQILSKVGGQPWAMKFPMKSFMIVGIDTYHDTIDRKRSCVGFVASMNEYTSSWWSHTFFQDSLQEIGQRISNCLVAALKRFHRFNGFIPSKIIVYRDGVGDSQLETVVKYEITQAVNGLQFYIRDEHSDMPEPQISYIIVQKRINTKMALRTNGKVLNPLPGTYLDHTITHPDYNDFYLVSQHVNQGTVSPTKYILITETGNLKLMHHQKLAYKMTHMYFNWTGTIRVPAPCQYAHKLAYLSGESIRQQVCEPLEDTLYYL